MQTLKARGHRGSWFARIGDEDIPCIWRDWLTSGHYRDPGAKADDGKWVKYIEALEHGQKAVLTTKQEKTKSGKWLRSSYLSVWKIANVALTERGLKFDLVEKLPVRLG